MAVVPAPIYTHRRYRWTITNLRDRAALQDRLRVRDVPVTIDPLKARADEMQTPSEMVRTTMQIDAGMTLPLVAVPMDAVDTEFEELEQENVLRIVYKLVGGPGCDPQSETLPIQLGLEALQ